MNTNQPSTLELVITYACYAAFWYFVIRFILFPFVAAVIAVSTGAL